VAERYEQRAFAVPADATEILLVRHGASEAAVPGEPFELLEGHANPALSPVGQEQARRVAERLVTEPLHALYTSRLIRTVQTAAPLAERLGLQPTALSDLNEVRLGDWEGGEFRIRGHQGDPMFFRVLEEERWDLIPNGESNESLGERVRRGIERIVGDAGPGVSVAAFVHGGVIGELCHQATESRPFAFVHADNCSVSRLVVLGNGRWLLRSFNDTAHLA
jgi:2,3-bisphosphoglycerate-dependent phosphoglycerate mutase